MSNYTAEKIAVDGIEVVRLADAAHKTEVSIIPSVGNFAYQMKVNGHNILWWPYKTLTEFRAKPGFAGIPFLAPWANRLDQDAFWANGKKYALNPDLGNFRRDQNRLPIHGLVSYATEWQVVNLKAEDDGAEVTSRLEFWKNPEWMAQFPFAHTIDMTYRLADGVLEVRTMVENHSIEPLPLAIGYHPYYQITDAPRDQWKVHLAAKDHYELSSKLIPTGATKPIDLPDPVPLAGHQLDDVFGGVNHLEEFSVQGARQKISIRYGPKFTVAVVYAPPGKDFICFEPMTAVTNAFNLAHDGIYKDLQSIAPATKWQESFWISPTGF
jgi:aldose 1-epimerase